MNDSWKMISINGISGIDKCVGEFYVWVVGKVPSAKFKIKILEDRNGKFKGISNLHIKGEDGFPEGAVGFGASISLALEDTINEFLEMLSRKKDLSDSDFEFADPYDF